jgi:Bacterial SH3 domain
MCLLIRLILFMVFKKCVFLLAMALFPALLSAQNWENRLSGSHLTSLWNSAALREKPGKDARLLTSLSFGETVESLEEEAFIKEENRSYLKVRSHDGKVGWVHAYLFVKGGALAVVLGDARIYKRPATPSSITSTDFTPGELVVADAVAGEWVSLSGLEKKKSGWINGLDYITLEPAEVEMAALIQEAAREKDLTKRRQRLELLMAAAQSSAPALLPVIRTQLTAAAQPQEAPTPLITDRGIPATSSARALPAAPAPTAAQASILSIRPVETEEGRLMDEVTETGSIYEVKGPENRKNVFFAYHKTLPSGTRIYIQLPDNAGFVELEIINRLRQDNAAALGLSRACTEAIFGTRTPQTV